MRILIVTSSYPRGPDDTINAGVFVRDFALALTRAGCAVEVITHRKRGASDYREPFGVHEFSWLGDEPILTSLDLKSLRGAVGAASLLLSGARLLRARMREFEPDAVLAMWAVPSGFIARLVCPRLGVPFAVWLLGSDVWRYERGFFGRAMLRWILDPARLLLADGIELGERVRGIVNKSPRFLPSSRDMTEYLARAEPARGVEDSYLFVGRFEFNKGPDVLADAIEEYVARGGRSRFLLFGLGSLKERVERKLNRLAGEGRVVVGGVIGPDELAAHLKAVRALVIPSRVESIPVIFSDAMQARCPVIATDVGDLKALVERFGVGFVVPKEDPQSLAAAFERMDAVERASFEDGCREAAAMFSPDGSARSFMELIGHG